LNLEVGTLEFPPTLREKALEILKIFEDVKEGRLKVDRDMDELTLELQFSEHPGRCRGYRVVTWKYAFKGNNDTYRRRRRRREHKEEQWFQMMKKALNNKKKGCEYKLNGE
jgi:hypothetical protein